MDKWHISNSVIERDRQRTIDKSYGSNVIPNESKSQEPQGNKMQWNDFLNPRSMLTPGLAGSSVMLIANTLWVQFLIPQKWSALLLSFLVIIPILIKFSASLFENIIYFIFNGLIVFSLAVNTNFVGAKFQEVAKKDKIVLAIHQPISTILKTSFDSSDSNMQLASNPHQEELSKLTLLAENQQNVKDFAEKKPEKKREQKNKDEKSKDNRKFFGKWF